VLCLVIIYFDISVIDIYPTSYLISVFFYMFRNLTFCIYLEIYFIQLIICCWRI